VHNADEDADEVEDANDGLDLEEEGDGDEVESPENKRPRVASREPIEVVNVGGGALFGESPLGGYPIPGGSIGGDQDQQVSNGISPEEAAADELQNLNLKGVTKLMQTAGVLPSPSKWARYTESGKKAMLEFEGKKLDMIHEYIRSQSLAAEKGALQAVRALRFDTTSLGLGSNSKESGSATQKVPMEENKYLSYKHQERVSVSVIFSHCIY